MALKLDIQVLRYYLKLTCEYRTHTLPNTEVGIGKDHGKSCMKVRPPLVRHLVRIRLLGPQITNVKSERGKLN